VRLLHCCTHKYSNYVTTLTITLHKTQGLTAEDMLDWSTHLYHASAIANGGGYLLDKERSREKAFEEERARRAQARAAELEAAERRQVTVLYSNSDNVECAWLCVQYLYCSRESEVKAHAAWRAREIQSDTIHMNHVACNTSLKMDAFVQYMYTTASYALYGTLQHALYTT
jgi:hypothetical protein